MTGSPLRRRGSVARTITASALGAAVLLGCGSEVDLFRGPIDCGPINDPRLCKEAVRVALTAKINPPPLAAATIRRPTPDDDCATWFHVCGESAVIVVLGSGDTLQDVPLLPTDGSWVRLDRIR